MAGAVGAVGLAACGSTGAATTAPPKSASGQQVAKVSDIKVGEAISADVDGHP